MVREPGRRIVDEAGDKRSGFPKLVQELLRVGPRLNEISRLTNQYKETVRYRYKKLIYDRGFALQARVNHEALGLRRIICKVWMNKSYKPHAQDIFLAMHQLCYVNGFSVMMPEGFYHIQASVPREHVEKFAELFNKLKSMGIFDAVEIFHFDWFRNTPMRAELFDFEHGIWDFDWKTHLREGSEAKSGPSPKATFDRIDLLIIRELQEDATRQLLQVRDGLQEKHGVVLNYKTLDYHYAKHVLRKGLIRGYRLNWIGTRYDYSRDKPMQRKHTYNMMAVYVKGISEGERLRLIGTFNRLPFLWCEAAGDDYYAEIAFPPEMTHELMDFLMAEVFESFGPRTTYHTIDQTRAFAFTISPDLWSGVDREWKFDSQDLLLRFENLVLKIKGQAPEH